MVNQGSTTERLSVLRGLAREGESAGQPPKKKRCENFDEFGRPCQDVSERPHEERPVAKGRAQRAALFSYASKRPLLTTQLPRSDRRGWMEQH